MDVDALGITPSALALLSSSDIPPSLRQVNTVGEALSQQVVDDWADKVDLIVSYGLSECAQLNFSRKLRKGDNPRVLGAPNDTTKPFILEPDTFKRRKSRESGELCLAGPQIATSYYHRPEQTAAVFIDPNPFGGRRLYRTGDLAICHQDGNHEILGRIDYQVKINGQRLEPEEITAKLLRHPDVCASAVVGANIRGGTSLVAAVVPASGVQWANLVKDLRESASRSLNSYMVPSYWLQLEAMPINANGKVDIKEVRRLAECTSIEDMLGHSSEPSDHSELPLVGMELALRNTWAKVLQIGPSLVTRSAGFAALGGSSMDVIQVVRELRQQGVEADVGDIVRSHRLSDVNVRQKDAGRGLGAQDPSKFELVLDPRIREELSQDPGVVDAYPPTPLQVSLLASTLQGNLDYLYQRTYDIGHLDLAKLRLAFQAVFSASDILRTTFTTFEHCTLQVVRNDFAFPWEESPLPLEEYKTHDKQMSINFNKPFVRIAVLQEQLLVVSMHHSLFDFWSHHFLYEDTARLYSGLSLIERPPFRRFVNYLQHEN